MRVRGLGALSGFCQGLGVALLLAVSGSNLTAQTWGRFETAVSVEVGVNRVSYADGWGFAREAAVRQTFERFVFLDAEVALDGAPLPVLCLQSGSAGGYPSCSGTWRRRSSYLSFGGGVQLPVGWLRPFAGLTPGRMTQEDNIQGGYPARITGGSRSRFVGVDVRLIGDFRARLEYRQRYDKQAGDGTEQADQWLFGMSLRIGSW